jgi:hypothetical protein
MKKEQLRERNGKKKQKQKKNKKNVSGVFHDDIKLIESTAH